VYDRRAETGAALPCKHAMHFCMYAASEEDAYMESVSSKSDSASGSLSRRL
jgi:hypothetical protein